MAKGSRTDAEATYARAQKRVREASLAMTEAQTEAKRVDDNTARLRALRLAKEAVDAAEAAAMPKAPAKKARTVAKKKPAASADKKPKASRPSAAK